MKTGTWINSVWRVGGSSQKESGLGFVWCNDIVQYVVLSWVTSRFFFILSKWTQDLLTQTPYLFLTVCSEKNTEEGECIHLLPNCLVRMEVCSCLPFALSFYFFLSLYFHTDLQPARDSWLSQFDRTENYRGSIKGDAEVVRIHWEEPLVQSPLMSHAGLG